MKLKKIILEEMADFDWMKSIKPTLHDLIVSDVIKNGDHISVSGPYDGSAEDDFNLIANDLRFIVDNVDGYVVTNGKMMVSAKFISVTNDKKTYDYMVKTYGGDYLDGLSTGIYTTEVKSLNVNWVKRDGKTIYEL